MRAARRSRSRSLVASRSRSRPAAATGATFDDLEKKTPVLAIGAPSGYAATDSFGSILLAVAPPGRRLRRRPASSRPR